VGIERKLNRLPRFIVHQQQNQRALHPKRKHKTCRCRHRRK